jgi:hypothetical protein
MTPNINIKSRPISSSPLAGNMCELITEKYACGCERGIKEKICDHNSTVKVGYCPVGVTRTERVEKWLCGKHMLAAVTKPFKKTRKEARTKSQRGGGDEA